jgi:cholesterol transport system auxiliary component
MTRFKISLILIIGLTLLLSACLDLKQPRNKIEYYSLEYDPPRMPDLEPVASVIKVERFSVAPIYNTTKIIYRDGSYQRASYAYHKWQANPGEFATYFLARDMQQSQLFKAVLNRDSRFAPSHVLEGNVDEFLESDTEDGWQAVLALSIVLMAPDEPDVTRKILFQKTYRSSKPCRQKNPRALAEAMSLAMSEASAKIIDDVYQHLANRQ